MHGLICKGIEGFVASRHGRDRWNAAIRAAGIDFPGFETVHVYDDAMMQRLFAALAVELKESPFAMLEDLGTWVCTHPPLEPIRRLFRFSGATFEEMLHALDEVHERARLALPDIDLPVLSLIEMGEGQYRVASTWSSPGAGSVVIGILRAMADDYGVLAYLEFETGAEVNGVWTEMIALRTLDARFAAPRAFELGGAA